MLAEHPGINYRFHFACPAPLCFYNIVAATAELRDVRAADHPCPWFGGGHTTLSWGIMSDQYLEPIWKLLDASVDSIKGTAPDDWDQPSLQATRAEARAYANTLALLMQPFFSTQQEISHEALRRWQERQAGRVPETPGIGRLKWKRPGGVVGDPSHPSWVTKEYDPANPTPIHHNLTDEQVAAVKAAKGMPVAMIATAFDVSERVVLALQKEG